jgi:hypothetical protein
LKVVSEQFEKQIVSSGVAVAFIFPGRLRQGAGSSYPTK